MSFPAAPAVLDIHIEGDQSYQWTGAAWIIQTSDGVTNLTVGTVTGTTVDVDSSTGTNATLPAATGTDAGVMLATDKAKLDGVETAATADQLAAEVPVAAITNLTATDVQAALAEHQTDIDALAGLGGVYAGSSATFAALPATREDGNPIQNGDTAILTVDDGGNQSGWYVHNGTSYTFAKEIPETTAQATTTLVGTTRYALNAEADAGLLTTAAVTPSNLTTAVPALETDTTFTTVGSIATYTGEDGAAVVRDMRIPTSAALPADDTNERLHVLVGHATLPTGLYANNGTAWFQM